MPLNIVKTEFDQFKIVFTLSESEKVILNVDGDCCSRSYIESIDDESVLQNCILNDVHEEEGPIKSDHNECATVKKWTFYKFFTNKGIATLSFRNDSNGYYNGSLYNLDDLTKRIGV